MNYLLLPRKFSVYKNVTLSSQKKITTVPLNHFSLGIPLAFWMALFLVGSPVVTYHLPPPTWFQYGNPSSCPDKMSISKLRLGAGLPPGW